MNKYFAFTILTLFSSVLGLHKASQGIGPQLLCLHV